MTKKSGPAYFSSLEKSFLGIAKTQNKEHKSSEPKHFAGRSQLTWEEEDIGYEYHEEGAKKEGPSVKVKRR